MTWGYMLIGEVVNFRPLPATAATAATGLKYAPSGYAIAEVGRFAS